MSITSCPGCGAPAEITERFTLASTDGPVAHDAVCCAGGHHYRMAADRLPAELDGPGRRQLTEDGAQRRGLAGAVAPE